jgi:hypothetical protein
MLLTTKVPGGESLASDTLGTGCGIDTAGADGEAGGRLDEEIAASAGARFDLRP